MTLAPVLRVELVRVTSHSPSIHKLHRKLTTTSHHATMQAPQTTQDTLAGQLLSGCTYAELQLELKMDETAQCGSMQCSFTLHATPMEPLISGAFELSAKRFWCLTAAVARV